MTTIEHHAPGGTGGLPNPLSNTADRYGAACEAARLPGGHAGAMDRYAGFYRNGRIDQPHFEAVLPALARSHDSDSNEGVVRKFCLTVPGDSRTPDRTLETESVIIPMIGKKRVLSHTLCVSSQIGCAMGCGFCQTAQMGLIRHLTVSEIVAQWWVARHVLGCATIGNVVFMGMGEPMDNLDNVLGSIEVLTDHRGPAIPMNKVTISTVGRIDGLRRLGARVREPGWHRLNLAVSLNAPSDKVRSQIMPVNRAMPMADLRGAIEAWPIYGAAKICFEYVLIPGVNDDRSHAAEIADYILGRGPYAGRPPLRGLLNLIPYNPRNESPWRAPEEPEVEAFLAWLIDEGVYAKRRRTKGRETMAACGQLGNPALRRRPATGVQLRFAQS